MRSALDSMMRTSSTKVFFPFFLAMDSLIDSAFSDITLEAFKDIPKNKVDLVRSLHVTVFVIDFVF